MTDVKAELEAWLSPAPWPRSRPERAALPVVARAAEAGRSTATTRPTSRCSSRKRARSAIRARSRRRSSPRCRHRPGSRSAEIAGAGFINCSSRRPRAQRSSRGSSPSASAFGRGDARRGRAGDGRVRLGESDRAAARRPRPPGGARRRDRRRCSNGRARRSRASSTTTTPAQQIQNLAISVRARAQELLGEHATFPRTATAASTSARSRSATSTKSATTSATSSRSAGSRSPSCARSRTATCRRSACEFDNYYLESSLYTDGRVERRSTRLARIGKTYEQDGALWLRTTDFGDDKDRVMRKSDGGYTYFVPDVAYHVTKWERGFGKRDQRAGLRPSQHRRRACAPGCRRSASAFPTGYPDYVLHKMVTVMRGGEEVKISKRAGSYVTVRDLIDEVGPRRGALLPRLAQGRHASSCSTSTSRARRPRRTRSTTCSTRTRASAAVLRQAGIAPRRRRPTLAGADLAPLGEPVRGGAAAPARRFPGRARGGRARARAARSSRSTCKELAGEFHSYYNAERFLVDDVPRCGARGLLLAAATGRC